MLFIFLYNNIIIKTQTPVLIWYCTFFTQFFTTNLQAYTGTIPVGFTVQLGAPYEGERLVGVGSGSGTNSIFTTTGIIPPV